MAWCHRKFLLSVYTDIVYIHLYAYATDHSSFFHSGIDSMGLFWSMKPVPGASRKTRILKDDVMTPLVFTLSVMDGHIAFDDLQLPRTVELATGELERWYKHPTVHRIVVREGRLRGTLFLPPGMHPLYSNKGKACLICHRYTLTYPYRYSKKWHDLTSFSRIIDLQKHTPSCNRFERVGF